MKMNIEKTLVLQLLIVADNRISKSSFSPHSDFLHAARGNDLISNPHLITPLKSTMYISSV